MGHTVLEASNGVEELRPNREAPLDLVITDLLIPEKEEIKTIMEKPFSLTHETRCE
jgi:hypothetical protein